MRRRGGQGPHLAKRWEPRSFLELRRDSRVTTGISAFPLGWPWEAQSSPRVARESWGLRSSHRRAEETSPRRVRDLIFLSTEGRDLGVAFQAPPGSQASSRGEAKDSALLSSGDADLLEPTEWPQGSPASSSVWREDPGFLSRPCRNRRPSARQDGGVSGVSSSCGARGGFLPRHDEDLREPLVQRQGSQVCMREASGAHHCSLVQRGDKGLKTL